MLGIVTGLAAEARLARPLGRALAGGGMPAGAQAVAERLVADGASGLISFGLAGGLDPALAPGTVVVPAAVVEDGRSYGVDAALAARLGRVGGTQLAAHAVVVGLAERAHLFAATGAGAVDLESGAVARVAKRHDLPFAVLRAVCDPAWHELPPAALVALDRRGGIGMWRVLASIAREPEQVKGLVALARGAAAARAALRRRVAEIGVVGFVIPTGRKNDP